MGTFLARIWRPASICLMFRFMTHRLEQVSSDRSWKRSEGPRGSLRVLEGPRGSSSSRLDQSSYESKHKYVKCPGLQFYGPKRRKCQHGCDTTGHIYGLPVDTNVDLFEVIGSSIMKDICQPRDDLLFFLLLLPPVGGAHRHVQVCA